MTHKDTHVRNILKPFEQEHVDMLQKADHLYNSLNNLQYEGKISIGKNIKEIANVVKFFKKKVWLHVKIEEDVLFLFLERHLPKVEPTLQFLRADHGEFKVTLRAFESLFQKFKKEKNDLKRHIFEKKFKDKGIYLVCLMRHHIQLERESVYKSIEQILHVDEKQELLKNILKHKKRKGL